MIATKPRQPPPGEIKILFARSGNRCAFPGCTEQLVEPGTSHDGDSILGQIAHIVAHSRQGPRGNWLLSEQDLNCHPNLILLCPNHHRVVDVQPKTYSVPVLRQMKRDHEERVTKALASEEKPDAREYEEETIHSSVLPVTHVPVAVFSAPCGYRDRQEDEVKRVLRYPEDEAVLVRFVLRDKRLFTFHNLNDPRGPFAEVIDRRGVEVHRAAALWRDPEGRRRYVTLLNRGLFKYAARRGIRYDPNHCRFFFPIAEAGQDREVWYRSLNRRRQKQRVAWQPRRKSTGERRNFWWHRAAGIRFHQCADDQWYLTIRPERHLTSDGSTPLPPRQIGPRVTRKKARMWNDVYLSEVHFWRDYLSGGTPRILLHFGDQSAIVSTTLLSVEMHWPGIPGDKKPFRNRVYEEDLFSYMDLRKATDESPEPSFRRSRVGLSPP